MLACWYSFFERLRLVYTQIAYEDAVQMPSTRRNIRILVWNVWYRAQADEIVEALDYHAADVLMLQELTISSKYNPGTSLPKKIAHELNYNGLFVGTREFGKPGETRHREGIAIFSRLPITSTRVIELSHGGTLRGSGNSRRCYLQVGIHTLSGMGLTVGLAHLSYPLPGGIGRSRRRAELEQLKAAVAGHDKRFLLAGDFNDQPESEVVSWATDSFKNLGPENSQASWLAFSKAGLSFGRRLDYAFGTPDLNALGTLDSRSVSNHRPIKVTIIE